MINLFEHTIWCQGTHDDGECLKQGRVGRDRTAAVVRIKGIPGDYQHIEVDGVLINAGEVAAAITLLTEYRDNLAAQDEVEPQLNWDTYPAAEG